jgi:hypothetical protein
MTIVGLSGRRELTVPNLELDVYHIDTTSDGWSRSMYGIEGEAMERPCRRWWRFESMTRNRVGGRLWSWDGGTVDGIGQTVVNLEAPDRDTQRGLNHVGEEKVGL